MDSLSQSQSQSQPSLSSPWCYAEKLSSLYDDFTTKSSSSSSLCFSCRGDFSNQHAFSSPNQHRGWGSTKTRRTTATATAAAGGDRVGAGAGADNSTTTKKVTTRKVIEFSDDNKFSTSAAAAQAQAHDDDDDHDPDHLNRELPSFGKSREFRSFGTHDGSYQSTNNSNYSNYSGSGSGSASASGDGDGSHNDNSSYGTTFLRPSFVMAKDVDAVYNNNKNYTYLTSARSESSSSCTEVTANTATTPKNMLYQTCRMTVL
ncbi:hypothetical protein FRACYDRAFT_237482 [Fragilariopsis cylindrus CCMP1102]|uniref:Uncharacterized protein n=1 Tax=Fragilariopsis cylindrus CCMP1102 TaxID=635003 RepID=A0A1E7FM04_9STRA|nr:hypothetical protein FRACYDRAFT_237482 [Fragilariopsis cylindrus CCMP1102]|eukprot:OEU19191.1 hypothetical protein FRACYDRAFT_237482 [Fragilariopsis cylindrus CCMP1102]